VLNSLGGSTMQWGAEWGLLVVVVNCSIMTAVSDRVKDVIL